MKIRIEQDIAALRSAAYPPLAEQIGALMKAEQARQAGQPVPADAIAVIDRVAAVKAQYPKTTKGS